MLGELFSLSNIQAHQRIFIYGLYLSYLLFALVFTGLFYVSPHYLHDLRTYLTYYSCAFIIIRFNPFVKRKNTIKDNDFERRVVFSTAIFLLLTTSFTNIFLTQIPRV